MAAPAAPVAAGSAVAGAASVPVARRGAGDDDVAGCGKALDPGGGVAPVGQLPEPAAIHGSYDGLACIEAFHYVTDPAHGVRELRRVVKPGGVALIFTDWRQLPATTDAVQSGGWVWRGVVPWYKPSSRPMPGGFSSSCEYVVWGSAGPMERDYKDGVYLPGFFQANAPRDREHLTQKPVDIMQKMVAVAPEGGTILDIARDLHFALMGRSGSPVEVVVVCRAGLGTLNHTELTTTALRAVQIEPAGLVIGSWPTEPGLAEECNRTDLTRLTGVPVVGVLPEGAGALGRDEFLARAPGWFTQS